MTAVPFNISLLFEFQDNRGFRSTHKINAFDADVTSFNGTVGSLFDIVGAASTSIGAKLQALSNAKLIKSGVQLDWNYAQEPSSETGTYQLVMQQADLQFGDGNGGFSRLRIPAPVDALFLTTGPDNLIVVNPAATVLTDLQTAMGQTISQGAVGAVPIKLQTPRAGVLGSLFFGGQLIEGKPRVRRVLTGA